MDSIKLENIDIPNFDPSSLNKGQEMIFTLKDSNVLDDYNDKNIQTNLQIDEIKYDKNTGISIEKVNENEFLEVKNEKNDVEIKDDGQIIDESTLLNKLNKIKNKIEQKGESLSKKKKFQEEFYNEEELKLLNKKKKRKKNAMALFDIDINDEENIDEKENNKIKKIDNGNEKDYNNNNINNNEINENTKKSIFTSEDKEMLENLFDNKKKINEKKVIKNIINIDENFLENNNNDNNDNIRMNKSKNVKILDDYAIFLDNLPVFKKKDDINQKYNFDSDKEKNKDMNNKNDIKENNNTEIINTDMNEKMNEEKEEDEDEYTFKPDDDIPLISDEPIVGKGVCVALQIFKNKKMLRKEEEFGRYHDKKYENITNGVNEEHGNEYDNNTLNIKDKNEYYRHKEINIEYRDENGRKLRPKEMARYQALIFHGSKSSVRKREKKLLREKYQVFVQNPDNNKTLNYMNFMKDKNHQAFATLQGKSTFL